MRARLRDLGLKVGYLPTGPLNAITDVAGVKVGVATLITDTPHIVRTGVTAIWPRGPEIWQNYCFAGTHSFNGNGEMTGIPWIAEQGLLGAPICITNTWSVGTVRDAISAVLVTNVVDHLAATLLTEVDVEVGHRHAFRIQEAFEQQVIAQRIEIGDAQAICNQ